MAALHNIIAEERVKTRKNKTYNTNLFIITLFSFTKNSVGKL